MRFAFLSSLLASSVVCVLGDAVITTFPDSLALGASFDPVIAAYWTGLPHHRRTPFSVSPDGKSAYLAYLDSGKKNVYVQQVDVTTFAAVGTAFSTAAYEAAGLVAQNDGFALLATVDATGTTDIPPNDYPIVAVIRVKAGAEVWRTPMNGPGVHAAEGVSRNATLWIKQFVDLPQLTATPDANGDLVYSETSGLYAAYFVVTGYTGDFSGHFGDSIQYVDDSGSLQDIASSSVFGCSHNTGIGLEAADAPPYASVCAEDQGSIWLNTDTQYMSGVKIANENTTNGVSGEPMGGMSGSYSNLALFPGTTSYIFAWQSRGALDLTLNAWLGAPYTQCSPRWLNHNVAIATTSSKNKLTGAEASSDIGAAEGDSQINWITYSDTDDHQNVHVAALDSSTSLVSWETLTSPTCEPVPLSCSGTFAGTSFQVVDSAGAKVGAVTTSTDVTVSGDMAVVGGKICWPYVNQVWDLSAPKDTGTLTQKMSFACAAIDGSGSETNGSVASSSSLTTPVSSATSSGGPVATSAALSTIAETASTSEALVSSAPSSVSEVAAVAATPSSPIPSTMTTIVVPSATPSAEPEEEDDTCDAE
ncbi:hypothetical protein LSUE1_G004267 [Lachnellula suecica]|uniref:Uncharacterized protein n=1 Tax=Lachnellula suecica TaxID=602035 RepID=A0A8T9C397_9HELO|nr:hypothetical protein LSUE1_G004267 [Lachnellula suecica]